MIARENPWPQDCVEIYRNTWQDQVSMNQTPKKLWIVTEGLTGTENQCWGVAEALRAKMPDLVIIPFRTRLREPWRTLSPWLGFEQWWSFEPAFNQPWPDILITSGRKAIAAARFIKQESGGKTFTLHIQDPKVKPDEFDLVAVPQHDPLRGKNVIVTTASPNRITPEKLENAKVAFPALENLPTPRVAVLIGGTSKTHQITKSIAEKLLHDLETLGQNATLMITTSRRTPESLKAALHKKFASGPHVIWDGAEPNPYLAYLGWADAIIATNDSASMLSEAASTGKPVYKVALQGGSPKFDKLYTTLEKSGALFNFTGMLEDRTYTPLRDAEKVAQAVLKKWEQQMDTDKRR